MTRSAKMKADDPAEGARRGPTAPRRGGCCRPSRRRRRPRAAARPRRSRGTVQPPWPVTKRWRHQPFGTWTVRNPATTKPARSSLAAAWSGRRARIARCGARPARRAGARARTTAGADSWTPASAPRAQRRLARRREGARGQRGRAARPSATPPRSWAARNGQPSRTYEHDAELDHQVGRRHHEDERVGPATRRARRAPGPSRSPRSCTTRRPSRAPTRARRWPGSSRRGARAARRAPSMPWTAPESENPSTRGQKVSHTIEAASRRPDQTHDHAGPSEPVTRYRVVGKPRSICDSEGSGQRVVTTLARV